MLTVTQQWTLDPGPECQRFLRELARIEPTASTRASFGPIWDPAFAVTVCLDVGMRLLASRVREAGIPIEDPPWREYEGSSP